MLNLLLLSRHPELVSGSHYKKSHTTDINTMLKSSPMRCWNKFSMTFLLLFSINLLLLSRHPELVSGSHYKRSHTTDINTMLKSSPMRCCNKFSMTFLLPSSVSCLPSSINLLLLSRHPELVSGSHYKRFHTTNINTMLKLSSMRCWNKFSMTSSLLLSSIFHLPAHCLIVALTHYRIISLPHCHINTLPYSSILHWFLWQKQTSYHNNNT